MHDPPAGGIRSANHQLISQLWDIANPSAAGWEIAMKAAAGTASLVDSHIAWRKSRQTLQIFFGMDQSL